MPINVNGYNATFQEFADFAKIMTTGQGDENSIARVGTGVNIAEGSLAGRTITASTTDSVRGFFKWFRSADDKAANNEVRKLFKDAIIDMFGGESKIPESVKDAMKLADYDKGKPLTARRIIAVQNAIDASGTKEARTDKLKLETFESPAVEQAARNMGYLRSEMPKLARAAHFYAQAQGVSEADALQEVGRPGSEANRLMQYGGRFLENAENFADGLRLVSKFSEWHDELSSAHASLSDRNPDYGVLNTPTKINAYSRAAKPDAKLALERFIFEDIATNPSFNLKETDAERAFGVEHNPVSRHMIAADNVSVVGTLTNIPPEKRRVVFAAFNAFQTLAPSAEKRNESQKIGYETQFLARILRHLPKLEALMAKGPLTGRDVIKTCFPDIRNPGNCDISTIKTWEDDISSRYQELEPKERNAVSPMLEGSGATLDEALAAAEKGKTLPTVPFFTDAQYSIEEASSAADSGISTMNGDINRQSPYMMGEGDDAKPVFPINQHAWKFKFPDGERLETSGSKHADIPRVGQKIKDLCGEVHPKQIGTVAYLLSQSGVSILKNQPLAKFGISTNEHSPVNFALSRNAETGAVTITYTSPKELPVKFSWTATVGVDGAVTQTPFTIEKPVGNISRADAKKTINDAVKNCGVNLTNDQIALATDLYAQHAKGLLPKNASVFANYLVSRMVSPLGMNGEDAESLAANLAKDIKDWDDFDLGDPRLADVGKAVAEIANNHVKEKINDENWFMENPGYQDLEKNGAPRPSDIASQFWSDVPSGGWNINGTEIKFSSDLSVSKVSSQKVIDQFNKAVDGSIENAERRSVVKKVLTTLLHQGNFSELEFLSRKQSQLSGIKGSELFVSKDMNGGDWFAILSGSQKSMGLEISKDGKTATVTVSIAKNITCDGSMSDAGKIGVALWAQKMTVDLTKDIPEVTNVTFSQQFEPGKVEISHDRINANLQMKKTDANDIF